MRAKYTQGVMDDGAAILKDGEPMTIEEVLAELRQGEKMLQAAPHLYLALALEGCSE